MNSNNYYEGYNPLWESNANKAFWCVLAIAILGLFGGIADTVLMTMAVGQVASDVVGSNASLPVSGSLVMSVLLKVAMVVVFGLYVWALDGFAQVQRRWEDARSVRQVKTAVIIQLICFILMMMIPLLLRVSPGVLGLWIVVWIMVLVSCFMMKDGFNNLKQSELLNQKAQLAAENLRYAAVCTLNLLIMPVVVAIILAVIGLLTLGSLDSIIGSFRYSGFGIDTLNSAGNTYNSAVDALQTAKVLGIFVLIASGLLGLYWGVVAFVYPMIGWYRMQLPRIPFLLHQLFLPQVSLCSAFVETVARLSKMMLSSVRNAEINNIRQFLQQKKSFLSVHQRSIQSKMMMCTTEARHICITLLQLLSYLYYWSG